MPVCLERGVAASGGTGIGLGAGGFDGTDGHAQLAVLNLGLGTAALGSVVWRLLPDDEVPAPSPTDEGDSELSWFAHPTLSGDRAGARVELRF